jgi:glucoamylase
MVWCRDSTESGLALAALGHYDDAIALLQYLMTRQLPDGHWPRCFYVDGSFDPLAAVQLDETALPVILAARLEEYGTALPAGADRMFRQAAQYLAQNGPISGVERWEENWGGSAFTIGLEIVAMVVAATRLTGVEQQYALALADNWNERLEEFTYISGGELDRFFGTDGHYVRVGPPVEQIRIGNQPAPSQSIQAEALVGLEFLYLTRLGLRDPRDKRIVDTLKIADSMLSKDTPSGRAYNRYNLDGYGEWLDGSGWPVRHFGIGRPWPLLTGERGHYEVLAGRFTGMELNSMLAMRGRGGLLPEQIWDANPLPWRYLEPGKPAGSAMPLAWAHSELIKLAVAASTRRPVEMLTKVTDRYRAQVPVSGQWFWRDTAPVLALPPGRALVVEDTQPFMLHFGFDGWQGVTEVSSSPLGLGMFGLSLAPAMLASHGSLQFVRRYSDGHWEASSRNDVQLGVARPPALRRTPTAIGRLVAAGKHAE